ncbi:soluble quino protein glucose/sorbosone dehydrogenase [Lasiosphaeria ovina]|uniref:Soluble quino protein glucose/sorbosone dehydrogenase n=1 Tax=Lasiosphaeria ovina TaxID=92902 RepID=A0AAE0NAZ2_9PEZI|nr:soluble quino protein glucose/sorbosone dehydrogenase [Lasiosphaeria ovina]
MTRFSFAVRGVAALAWLPSDAAAQSACPGVTSRLSPKMGSGYKVNVLASGLQNPRHIAVDSAGNLLVAEGGSGSVQRLVLKEQGDIVCVQSKSALTSDQSTNHGIALSADGRTLFTSNLSSVTAYEYDADAGKVGPGKVLVKGMYHDGHPTRTLLVSRSSPDIIAIARGSRLNIDTPTVDQSSGRSMIKTFSIAQSRLAAIDYISGGEVLGWGLRNIVGMDEDPLGVWSVENSIDDLKLNGNDVHNENPAEKLNYHGTLGNSSNNTARGANFGYPWCVPAWNTEMLGVAGQAGLTVGTLFAPDDVPKLEAGEGCAAHPPGALHFDPHTAPLDFKFTANGSSAYIAFHGSWDRQPADGYRVMRIDFANGKPVAPPTSKTAAIPVMENSDLGSCPGGCFRPVGLAFDGKGRLYVSSDSTGEVYVVYGA